jgi:subtilisin-like proprotein convertase family protein
MTTSSGTLDCGAGAATQQTVASGESFTVFNGQNPQGNWTLRAYDTFNGDDGTLNSWAIEICTQAITLTSEDFTINDLAIYPNPNNGNFNVQFTSNSSNEINVGVHDMRGREIFTKTYTNNGLFNENLQLNNVQTGIYMVTIQDGSSKVTKKIVVE